jgi:hypothetical protein
MTAYRALDVSSLPTFAFGHRSPMWWGLIGMIAIESTMFGLLIATYFYLMWREPNWPPGVEAPALLWGSITTALLLISLVPNALAKHAGEELDLAGIRVWMVVSAIVALVIVVARDRIRLSQRVVRLKRLRIDRMDVARDAHGPPNHRPVRHHRAHGADVHGTDRRKALRGCLGERCLLVFRRGFLAAAVCNPLSRPARLLIGGARCCSGRPCSVRPSSG